MIVRTRRFLAVATAAGVLVAACGGGGTTSEPATPVAAVTPSAAGSAGTPAPSGSAAPRAVRLQLQWARQAQFAGYFAAIDQGYFEAAGIEVTIVDGGPSVSPHLIGSAPGGPEFTISWVPKVLRARATATSDLVDIAQIFQRSGTLSISWKDAEVTRPTDFKGLEVGVLGSGNELEVTAGAIRAGLVPGKDFTTVIQGQTMDSFLAGDLDVAQAAIYDEYAQVLEATNPATDALFQPTDLNVINWNDEGTAMLQDAIFARASWLAEGSNEALARDFLKASFQGWIYCRNNSAECVQSTVDAGTARGAGHQAWMLNQVNGLIWPSPNGIGVMDEAAWGQTVKILTDAAIIPVAPAADAYRTDLAGAALAELADSDKTGESFVKADVPISAGGT